MVTTAPTPVMLDVVDAADGFAADVSDLIAEHVHRAAVGGAA